MVDHLASAWFYTLSALQAKPRCLLGGSARWVPPSPSAVGRCALIWSYYLVCASGDANCYLTRKGGTRHVQAPRKASVEVSNLSKGEMCSNYFLSIYPRFLQPFTTLPEGRAPKALRSRISSFGTSRGPTINVFNFGGGRCRTLPPAPPRGPAIDVFNFSGGHCRTLPPAPPSGPAINVFNFGGDRCWICRQHRKGAHHRHLQLRWWPLLDLLPAPPRGPTIDVSNF
jgi:hypothetical protein